MGQLRGALPVLDRHSRCHHEGAHAFLPVIRTNIAPLSRRRALTRGGCFAACLRDAAALLKCVPACAAAERAAAAHLHRHGGGHGHLQPRTSSRAQPGAPTFVCFALQSILTPDPAVEGLRGICVELCLIHCHAAGHFAPPQAAPDVDFFTAHLWPMNWGWCDLIRSCKNRNLSR